MLRALRSLALRYSARRRALWLLSATIPQRNSLYASERASFVRDAFTPSDARRALASCT